MTVTGDPQDDVDLLAPPQPPPLGPGLPEVTSSPTRLTRARARRRRRTALIGTVTLVTCVALGIGLGVAATSDTPIGLLNPTPSRPPEPVPGRDGLTPASAPASAALAGDFVAGVVVDVRPDPGLLPATCPASAWNLNLASPSGPGAVRLFVSLAASAPQSCQGFSAPLPVLAVVSEPAGQGSRRQVEARTTDLVTVGILATPGLTLERRGQRFVVSPIRPPSGPQAPLVSVERRRAGGGWTTICNSTSWDECTSPADTAGAPVQFRVVASVGTWQRASAAVDDSELD